jgi:hypothetical protein
MSHDNDHVLWTGCTTCRRDQVGLWADERTKLQQTPPQEDEALSAGLLLGDVAAAEVTALLTDSGRKSGDSCTACCLTCPTHASCPGGALLVPAAGYWHSSPTSMVMHR